MPYEDVIAGRRILDFDGKHITDLETPRKGFFPIKLYTFRSYTDYNTAGGDLYDLRCIIEKHPEITEHHNCAVAQSFGFLRRERDSSLPIATSGMDFFALRLFDGSWEKNPMWDEWSYENGVYVPKEKGVCCGAGMVIMGREEELRAGCKDQDEYMSKWPDIGNLIAPHLR